MFYYLLFVLVASAAAAPHYPHHRWHHRQRPSRYEDTDLSDYNLEGSLFDTSRFWDELSKELMNFERMLQEFHQRFPSNVELETIEGNEYKITIPLAGYDEKDIVVKAREGVLMVQAVHKAPDSSHEDQERSYLGIRNLPSYVNTNGTWTYEEGDLKIVFPLINKPTTEATVVTAAPDQSREEMEPHGDTDKDADVGTNEQKGDKDQREKTDERTDKVDDSLTNKDNEILTNEVPRQGKSRVPQVEATTYAVDLKDEYEFVPVNY